MTRANKTVYHPNNDANNFSTVEDALNGLQYGAAAKVGGDVGATDNRLVRADGTGGKTIQGSAVGVDDSGNLTNLGTLTASGGRKFPVDATAAEYQANTTGDLALIPSIVWSAVTDVALVDGATIAVDMSTGFRFSVTIAGNRTLSNPTNAKPGQSGRFKVTASGGTRTIAVGTNFKKTTDITFPVSIASGQTAYIYYDVDTSSIILITGVLNNPA